MKKAGSAILSRKQNLSCSHVKPLRNPGGFSTTLRPAAMTFGKNGASGPHPEVTRGKRGGTGADFPNDYILKMFTMNAADLLGVNSGQIKEGLAADIIAMDENPLDDVTALRAVHFVMKDGRVYKHGGAFMWETPRQMNNPRRKPGRRVVE